MSARSRSPGRRAYTLIEVLMSGAIIAAVIVPAFAMMRNSLQLSERTSNTNTMSTLCFGKLEQHLVLAAAAFAAADETGDFSAEGQAQMRYRVIRTDDSSDGGIPDRLMAVLVTVWHDLDGDGQQDADEPHLELSSKIAKLASYQNAAGS